MASPTMRASCVLTRELGDTETCERLHHGLGHGRLGGGGIRGWPVEGPAIQATLCSQNSRWWRVACIRPHYTSYTM